MSRRYMTFEQVEAEWQKLKQAIVLRQDPAELAWLMQQTEQEILDKLWEFEKRAVH